MKKTTNKAKKKPVKKKILITKNKKISEILKKNPKSVKILMESGMFCVGCALAAKETLEQACETHGIDPEKILKKLNK